MFAEYMLKNALIQAGNDDPRLIEKPAQTLNEVNAHPVFVDPNTESFNVHLHWSMSAKDWVAAAPCSGDRGRQRAHGK